MAIPASLVRRGLYAPLPGAGGIYGAAPQSPGLYPATSPSNPYGTLGPSPQRVNLVQNYLPASNPYGTLGPSPGRVIAATSPSLPALVPQPTAKTGGGGVGSGTGQKAAAGAGSQLSLLAQAQAAINQTSAPFLAQLQAAYAAQGKTASDLATSNALKLANWLQGAAAQTSHNFGGAEQAQAALDASLQQSLSGGGSALAGQLAGTLQAAGQSTAPAAALGSIGSDASNVGYARASASLADLIGQGANATDYAQQLPRFALQKGAQDALDALTQSNSDYSKAALDFASKQPDAVRALLGNLMTQQTAQQGMQQKATLAGNTLKAAGARTAAQIKAAGTRTQMQVTGANTRATAATNLKLYEFGVKNKQINPKASSSLGYIVDFNNNPKLDTKGNIIPFHYVQNILTPAQAGQLAINQAKLPIARQVANANTTRANTAAYRATHPSAGSGGKTVTAPTSSGGITSKQAAFDKAENDIKQIANKHVTVKSTVPKVPGLPLAGTSTVIGKPGRGSNEYYKAIHEAEAAAATRFGLPVGDPRVTKFVQQRINPYFPARKTAPAKPAKAGGTIPDYANPGATFAQSTG